MNYSTLKKTVVLSFVSLVLVGMAFAQTNTTTPTKKMSDSVTTAKLFGGASQYNTWSVGLNIGIAATPLATGGTDKFHNAKIDLGYGLSVKDQLSHAFGIEFNYNGGTVKGDNSSGTSGLSSPYGFQSFSTNFNAVTLSGVVNVGSVSFLHRKTKINFFVSGGAGLDFYKPSFVSTAYPNGVTYSHDVTELVIPIGVGAKYRLTDKLDLNIGYNENFLDGFNFTGDKVGFPSNHDHYAYGYAGIEYTFGSKAKPSLEWVNPIAMMYDELYDAALRQEVEALKGRVKNVESSINDLKKDSDGDGVADQFDKCPNTPAGTVVDGSGCPIVFPKPCPCDTAAADSGDEVDKDMKLKVEAYDNIEFEFDSSVLKKSSYPILEATAAALKKTGKKITVAGYASSEGTPSYNMRLSKDRANSVKNWLVNSGVNAKQIKIKGYGETHPIADNSTEEGRIKNRRVEFKK